MKTFNRLEGLWTNVNSSEPLFTQTIGTTKARTLPSLGTQQGTGRGRRENPQEKVSLKDQGQEAELSTSFPQQIAISEDETSHI